MKKRYGKIEVSFNNNTINRNYRCKMIVSIKTENEFIPEVLRDSSTIFFGHFLSHNWGVKSENERTITKKIEVKDLGEVLEYIQEQKNILKEVIKANKALMKAIPQDFILEF